MTPLMLTLQAIAAILTFAYFEMGKWASKVIIALFIVGGSVCGCPCRYPHQPG
jgi:hypothetical protein